MNFIVNAKMKTFVLSNDALFWSLQLVGWLGISLVSYLSLNLWYNQFDVAYLVHNILQSIVGMLISWPMRYVFSYLWDEPLSKRLSFVVITAILFSIIWALVRYALFLMITKEVGVWSDFGGWIYPSVFIFLCWTALYHGIKYYQLLQLEHQNLLELQAEQQRESLKRAEAEFQAREAQLEMLRYQLNPHFLFNTLNSISALVTTNKNKNAQNMILQLSNFLRYSLSDDKSLQKRVWQEMEVIEQYLKIEQVRFGEKLQVEINLEPDCKNLPIPSLLIQPLVENAIKYSTAVSEGGGIIRVSAFIREGCLVLTVEDSGSDQGNNSGSTNKGTGVGLQNTRDRLLATYGSNFQIDMGKSELGGMKVEIQLPL